MKRTDRREPIVRTDMTSPAEWPVRERLGLTDNAEIGLRSCRLSNREIFSVCRNIN